MTALSQQDVYGLSCILERWFDSSLFSCHFIVGSESLEGQLVNSRAPFIYTHNYAGVLSMWWHKLLIHTRSAFVQMRCITAAKLVWTAVILNGSEASRALTSGRALKMYS